MKWHPMPSAGLPPAVAAIPPGNSGVYLIRQHGSILYVGESHTGRLRKTLARHFQHWDGKTAGPTYSRSGTDVAFVTLPDRRAVETQNRLIAKHRPRDNKADKPAPTWTQAAVEVLDALNPF